MLAPTSVPRLEDAAGHHLGLGKAGTALQFDGTDAYAETGGPVVDTSGNFTVSAWVKLDRTDGWRTAVGQDGPVMSTFFLQKTNDTNQFAFSTSGGRAFSTFTPVADRWYHLVGVRDAVTGTHTLYADGLRQSSFEQCLNDAATGPLSVGRARFGGGNFRASAARVANRPMKDRG